MNIRRFLKGATAVVTGVALLVPCILVPAADVNAATSYKGLDAASHTKAEIISYVKSHPWNNDAVTFETEPSATEPYVLGRVSDESAQSALNYLNIFRYIAGVNEVSLTDQAMDYAQAASLCNAANRSLSHSPTRPAGMSDELYSLAAFGSFNSNIAAGGNSLTNTILRYMLETNGDFNFGHRRQLLDYYYTDAGFGAAVSTSGSYYSATYVDAYMTENKAISYPGQYQPLEYFGTGYAWTVIVPQTIDTTTVHVTVTDVNKGTVWEFENNSDPGHQYMRIDKDSKSACLIFAPEDILYRDGDVYNVKITGIPSPISYDVHMFNIDNIPVESIRLSSYSPITIAGRSNDGASNVLFTPENASNKIINWSSSDESIATVKNYGPSDCTIYGVKEGKVTITGRPESGTGEVSFEFEVMPAPTAIEVPDEITVGVGQSVQLGASVVPSNSPVSFSFSGNDAGIAALDSSTFSNSRTVTGVAVGTTQVKVRVYYRSSTDTTYDSLTKMVKVNVVDPVYISSLSISGKTEMLLNEEDTATYVANISPSNATCKEVKWSSSSSSFKNMGNGVFKASTYGKFTVTAAAKDGTGIEDSLEVIVYKKYDTPSAPVLRTVTSDSVTLSYSSSYEYSMDGINWQTSNQFTGLKPDTTYEFYRRYAGRPGYYLLASDASEPLTVTTSSCVHSWDLTSTISDSTCVEAGIGVYTCTKCGATKQEELPLVGHTYVNDKAVAATCVATGLTAGSHCSVCGKVFTAQQVVAAYGHSWNSGTVTTKATCTTDGVRTYTCYICGDTKTESIPATGHTVVNDKAVAATCEASGLTAGSHCSVCREVLTAQQFVPATGHTVVNDKAVAATCEASGLTAGSHCSVCDKVLTAQQVIPAAGHTIVNDKAVAATCTKPGLTAGSHCSVCREVLTAQQVIPAAGHTVVNDKAVAATCTKPGLTAGSHCSVCDKVLTAQQVIPAAGHAVVNDKAVAATCTKPGLTAGSHCSVCDKVLTAQQEIPATGHNWGEGVLTKKATFDEPGVRTYTCKNCGKTKEEATSTGIRNEGGVWVYYEDDAAKTDFAGKVKYDGSWYYIVDGGFLTGWQQIGSDMYFFDADGVMAMSWQTIDGKKYYFNSKTGVMTTGWKTVSKKQYFFDTETGVMATSWKTIDGKRYYFNKTTGVVTTGWKKISNKWYYFDPDKNGAAVAGVAKKISGKYYLFDAKGVMLTSGWKKDSKGNTYNLNSKGVAAVKKWAKKSKKWYYFGSNGKMVVNKSLKIGKKTYKFDKKGVCKNP